MTANIITAKALLDDLLYGNHPALRTVQEDVLSGSVARRCEDFCDQISDWLEQQGIAHKVVQSASAKPGREFEHAFIILTGEDLHLDPTAYQYAAIDKFMCFIGPKQELLDIPDYHKIRDDWAPIWEVDRVIKDCSDLPIRVVQKGLEGLRTTRAISTEPLISH